MTTQQQQQRPRLHVVRSAPERIVCPPWCEVPLEEHRKEADDPLLDFRPQHLCPAGSLVGNPDLFIELSCIANADGTDQVARILLSQDGGGVARDVADFSVGEAEGLAQNLLAAVAWARDAAELLARLEGR